MAISDTITSMYENVGNVYDVLELAGADLTNVDKNIENLKQSWEERLLYFLANGTDVVWNNWLPKVTGTGETITLNNTIEAKMNIVYKGNTYQYSTTGKNLFNVNATHENNLSDAGITATFNSDGTITVNGTKNANYKAISYNITLPAGTYYFSGCPSGGSGGGYSIIVQTTNEISSQIFDTGNGATFTLTEQKKISFFPVRVGADAVTFNNAVFKPMIARVPVTYNDYEPYTGGNPAPNPDYPQDIQVVSGDNTIKVEGKNLVNLSSLATETSNGITLTPVFEDNKLQYININGTSTALTVFSLTTYTTTTNNVLNGCFGGSSSTYKLDFWISGGVYANFNNEDTQLPNNSLGTLRIVVYSGKTVNNVKIYPMISTSGGKYQPYQSASYPINLGNIELCKIGDYQDKIAKSSGKNLFDKDTIEEGKRLGSDGLPFTDTSFDLSDYIKVDSNTQYTYSRGSNGSGSSAIAYYDSSKTFISRTMPIMDSNAREVVLTTPNNATYVRIADLKTTLDSMQFEKGNQATTYEPYGKVWYLNKQIGKVVLDGSENWGLQSINSYGIANFNRTINDFIPISQTENYSKNDRFTPQNSLISGTQTEGYLMNNAKQLYIRISSNRANTVETFKTWLSTHNTKVYYVLETPTTTEITDTTLISQLEAIKKSYNTQTNISQTNADKPFILDVVALGELI